MDEQQSNTKKTINVTDGSEPTDTTDTNRDADVVTTSSSSDTAPEQPDKPTEADKLAAIESENEATGTQDTTVAPAPIIDNEHTITNQVTQTKLDQTSAALAKEKTKRRSRPMLIVLLALLIAILGGIAALAVYKAYFEKQPQPATTPTQQVINTFDASTSQDQKVRDVIAHVKTLLPSVATKDVPSLGIHRQMPAPYNFYAAPSQNNAYNVGSPDTLTNAQGATAAKAINSYFVNDQKATADALAKEGGETFAIPTSTTTGDGLNFYRYTTADYTCAMLEQGIGDATPPYAVNHTSITVSCDIANNYKSNADAQKPFYAAYNASGKTSSSDAPVMLGMPSNIKASKTAGYQTATLDISTDGAMVGGAAGLFYQTPDKTWHFFMGSQNDQPCSLYNTPDLKKAYLGEPCGAADGKESTVSL